MRIYVECKVAVEKERGHWGSGWKATVVWQEATAGSDARPVRLAQEFTVAGSGGHCRYRAGGHSF